MLELYFIMTLIIFMIIMPIMLLIEKYKVKIINKFGWLCMRVLYPRAYQNYKAYYEYVKSADLQDTDLRSDI